jgi:hypothetical protein
MRTTRAAALLVSLSACDPGWSYVLPGAQRFDGRTPRYDLDCGAGVHVRFDADVFTTMGHTWIQIINRAGSALEVHPAATRILDAKGRLLPTKCSLPSSTLWLRPGEATTISCHFPIENVSRIYYDRRYKVLTLNQLGVFRDGLPFKLEARIAWVH